MIVCEAWSSKTTPDASMRRQSLTKSVMILAALPWLRSLIHWSLLNAAATFLFLHLECLYKAGNWVHRGVPSHGHLQKTAVCTLPILTDVAEASLQHMCSLLMACSAWPLYTGKKTHSKCTATGATHRALSQATPSKAKSDKCKKIKSWVGQNNITICSLY